MSHVSGDIWNERCYESKLQNADFPPAMFNFLSVFLYETNTWVQYDSSAASFWPGDPFVSC